MADIIQAVKWMGEGKKVKHSDWEDDSFVFFDTNCYDFHSSTGISYDFGIQEFKRKDWEIYEEKLKEPSALQERINSVYKSLEQIEKLNGTFVLKEAIKLFALQKDGE